MRGATDGAAQLGPAYELHTLTINGTNATGAPLPGSDVFVMNLDDARLFGAFGGIVDGQWKVSVPSGNYLIIADDFNRTVVSTTSVTDDTTTSITMADATVKPTMTLPGTRTSAPRWTSSPATPPTTAAWTSGTAVSGRGSTPCRLCRSVSSPREVGEPVDRQGLRALQLRRPHADHPPDQAGRRREGGRGRHPAPLTYHYRPADFAKVTIQHYATGAEEKAFDGWYGWSANDQFAFVDTYPSISPGVIHAMFEGSKDLSWASYTSINASFRSFTQLANQTTYRRGQHASMPFFRGPVTPVVDRGRSPGAPGPGARCASRTACCTASCR